MRVVLFGIGKWGKILAKNLKRDYILIDSKKQFENSEALNVNLILRRSFETEIPGDNVNKGQYIH